MDLLGALYYVSMERQHRLGTVVHISVSMSMSSSLSMNEYVYDLLSMRLKMEFVD